MRFGEAERSNPSQFFHAQGVGVGLRPPHYSSALSPGHSIPWFEVISENYMGLREGGLAGRPLHFLEEARKDYPIALHGVSLSIGSIDPVDPHYLNRLKELVDRIEPACVSDHLCWTGVDGENVHDLLPLPYTREALDHIVARTLLVQEALGRPILLENVSSYMAFRHSEMTEWEFLAEVSRRSGCGILLDINNIYVSSVNHRFDPLEFLRGIPRQSVGQFHLAGYTDAGTHLIDTHDHPVSEPVWELYRAATSIFGLIPTLIEWDDRLPEFEVLVAEAMRARQIQEETFGNSCLPSSTSPRRSPAMVEMGHH